MEHLTHAKQEIFYLYIRLIHQQEQRRNRHERAHLRRNEKDGARIRS